MRFRLGLFVFLPLLLVAASVALACGGSSDDKAASPAATSPAKTAAATSTSHATTAATASPAAAQAGVTVSVGKSATLGSILVNFAGMTLYRFDNDTPGVSNCTGTCMASWPPVTVTGTPKGGTGVAGTLGTITRSDGTQQATYNGSPVYMYVKDQKPGDTVGDGVGGIWHVVAP